MLHSWYQIAKIPILFSVSADPKGIELVIPSCFQDKEIVPIKSYYGGKEGNGEYMWYRIKEKLEESELLHGITASKDSLLVEKTLYDICYRLPLFCYDTKVKLLTIFIDWILKQKLHTFTWWYWLSLSPVLGA